MGVGSVERNTLHVLALVIIRNHWGGRGGLKLIHKRNRYEFLVGDFDNVAIEAEEAEERRFLF